MTRGRGHPGAKVTVVINPSHYQTAKETPWDGCAFFGKDERRLEKCLNLFVIVYKGAGDVRDYESTLSMKIDTCARPHA